VVCDFDLRAGLHEAMHAEVWLAASRSLVMGLGTG